MMEAKLSHTGMPAGHPGGSLEPLLRAMPRFHPRQAALLSRPVPLHWLPLLPPEKEMEARRWSPRLRADPLHESPSGTGPHLTGPVLSASFRAVGRGELPEPDLTLTLDSGRMLGLGWDPDALAAAGPRLPQVLRPSFEPALQATQSLLGRPLRLWVEFHERHLAAAPGFGFTYRHPCGLRLPVGLSSALIDTLLRLASPSSGMLLQLRFAWYLHLMITGIEPEAWRELAVGDELRLSLAALSQTEGCAWISASHPAIGLRLNAQLQAAPWGGLVAEFAHASTEVQGQPPGVAVLRFLQPAIFAPIEELPTQAQMALPFLASDAPVGLWFEGQRIANALLYLDHRSITVTISQIHRMKP